MAAEVMLDRITAVVMRLVAAAGGASPV